MAVSTAGQLVNWATVNNAVQNLHFVNDGKQIIYNDGTQVYACWVGSNGNLAPADTATYAILQSINP
jgi:hypothetical protein